MAAYASLTGRFYVGANILMKIFSLITLVVTGLSMVTLAIIYLVNRPIRSNIIRMMVVGLSPVLFLIPFPILYLLPNELEEQQHEIQVPYVAVGCDCAYWNIDIANGEILKGDAMHKESIFIEPASEWLHCQTPLVTMETLSNLPDNSTKEKDSRRDTNRNNRWQKPGSLVTYHLRSGKQSLSGFCHPNAVPNFSSISIGMPGKG